MCLQDSHGIEVSFGCPVNIELELDKALIRTAEQKVVRLDATCEVRELKIVIMIGKCQPGTRRQFTDPIQSVTNPLPIIDCLPFQLVQPWTHDKPAAKQMSDVER